MVESTVTTGFLSEKLEPIPGVKPKLDPRRSVPSLGTRSAARDFRIPGARKMTRRRERLMRFFGAHVQQSINLAAQIRAKP
jgi:hypothetical protein